MWSWVTNAVQKASTFVKNTINTVKKAATIVDKVSNVEVGNVVTRASSTASTVKKSWKEFYNQLTDKLERS